MGELSYGTAVAAGATAPTPAAAPPVVENKEAADFDVRISRVTRAQMLEPPSLSRISDEKWAEIEAWLAECVKAPTERRASNEERESKWRDTLSGIRKTPLARRDQSNLSVPLTIWACAAIRARMRAGTIESDPLITVTPNPTLVQPEISTAARHLVTFFTAAFRNPRELGGAEACDKIISDVVPIGTAALVVDIEPDRVRYAYDAVSGKPTRMIIKGRVRWDFIARRDLVYPLGFGTDVQAMPFIGSRFTWTWQEILSMRELKYLDPEAVESIKGQGKTMNESGGAAHVAYETHQCDRIYFDYPLFDDGHPVALVAYRQADRGVLLGLRYSFIPRGVRPILIANFDRNPDPTSPEGQGACEKLEGTQDETDEIHNLGIESAKRAIAHVIVLRSDSAADEEFGGDVPILPGDHISTERPDEDVKPIPLGDPAGMTAALAQETNSLKYVMRLLGLDESALGNVESGKRVPASLGLEIKKDSRVITAHAISNFGAVMTEAVYLTFELWKLRLPEDTLVASIGPDGAQLLKQSVFSTSDLDFRNKFLINFNATDAAATEESRKQQLLVVGQYLQSYYDRVMQYMIQAPQIPPPAQAAAAIILEKMTNGTRALVNTIDDIHNPDELIPKATELAALLQAMAPPPGAAPGGAPGAGIT